MSSWQELEFVCMRQQSVVDEKIKLLRSPGTRTQKIFILTYHHLFRL